MKQPDQLGRVAELLYADVGSVTSKVSTPPDLINTIHPRPSLIPGVDYPLTAAEERLLDLAWNHAIRTEVRR